jgi:HK97 family phage major capsid protein
VLSEKKLTGLVPIPNDLIRNASIGAEQFVRTTSCRSWRSARISRSSTAPARSWSRAGSRTRSRPAQKYAMTALTTAGKPTIGELKLEINKAKRTMKKANAPMRKLAWFMSPTVESGILNAVGPGGEGANAYEREMTERGTLAGYPYFVTNQIPETTSADLFLVDMDEVIIGESMALEVEVFPNGHFTSGGSVVSGISTDQTVIRAIEKHDLGMRHDVSGVCITGMSPGASDPS